jgi:hypothetical protein
MLLADGFEDAFLGTTMLQPGRNEELAIYSYDKCIEVLILRDGMTAEEAVEYFDYNVTGAWMGEDTPLFMYDRELSDLDDYES